MSGIKPHFPGTDTELGRMGFKVENKTSGEV